MTDLEKCLEWIEWLENEITFYGDLAITEIQKCNFEKAKSAVKAMIQEQTKDTK